MQLKDYQRRTLDALRDFLRACVHYRRPYLAFTEISVEKYGASVPYLPVVEVPDIPYVCLRLPTGGGKTLVAAYAIQITKSEFLHTDAPLVLWLAPSDAIVSQTLKALKTRGHPYREAVELSAPNVTVLELSEALYLQPAQMQGLTIIVSTMQAIRVEETKNRKVYEQNGSLMGHFPASIAPELLAKLEKHENGAPLHSLANVFALHRPLVIVDEAHNARTDLSFATLKRFAPACILEFTATPDTKDHPSNVLHTVSAAELKTEGMIKLPIYLETHQDWRVAISQAVAKRNELEALARAERAETGEYLRPIVLLQAQPTYKNKDSVNVEKVRECLLKDNQIPEKQVAVATGELNELEDDLMTPDSEVRYIITVQALREGWDCSFAYILCSVAELHSATAVEQILGRILRQPRAQAKRRPELNRAYAFATSLNFAQTANNLADALIQNGFERQEVGDLIHHASQQDQLIDYGPLFNPQSDLSISDQPIIVPNSVYGTPNPDQPFSLPFLAVRQGDFIDKFDDSYFSEQPIALAMQDPFLGEAEFPKDSPEGMRINIDINLQGHLSTDFLGELHLQNFLLASEQGVTKETLARWLDVNIPHADIPQSESYIFLLGMVERLMEGNRWALGELWREKYRLREAARQKIEKIRKAVKDTAFQQALFSTQDYELVVSPEKCFTFDPENYPYPPNSLFKGRHPFKKHIHEVVGDLKSSGEEYQCAQFLEANRQVNRWLRNLEGRPRQSFWLQTSTDRFYPDFICELTDSRYLILEYKGFDRWSDDDSKEKRAIGQKYEALGGGKYLFVMPQGPDWNAIAAKMG